MDLQLKPPPGYDSKPQVLADADANPDEAAEILQIANKRQESPATIALNPPMFKRMTKEEEATKLAGENPQINRYVLNNALASKVSADDYGNLNNTTSALQNLFGPPKPLTDQEQIERQDDITQKNLRSFINGRALEDIKTFGEGATTGYKQTVLSAERGRIGAKLGPGFGQPGDWTRVGEIDKQIAGLSSPNEFGRFIGAAAGMLSTGWEEGLVGAGVGAGIGTATGGLVGTVPGAIAGGLRGMFTGQIAIAMGNHYINMRQQGADEVPARLTAIGVGAVQAALLKFGVLPAAQSSVMAITRGVLSEAVADRAASQVLTDSVMQLGKAGLLTGAIGGAAELGNIVMEDLAKTFSTKDFSTIFNDPKNLPIAAKRVGEAVASFIAMVGPLHVAGIGTNAYLDMLYIRQALEKKTNLDAVMKTAQSSKTFERAPEYYEKFVAEHPEARGDVGIPKDIVAADPEKYKWIPNLEDQLTNPLGDEVKAPFASYVVNGQDLHSAAGDRVRIGDGLTEAEAKELKANPPDYQQVWHGSPYLFPRLGDEHFGKGEGANTYGQGHYVSEHQGIGEYYMNSVGEIVKDRHTVVLLDGQPIDKSAPRDVLQIADILKNRHTIDDHTGENAKQAAREFIERHRLEENRGQELDILNRMELQPPELFPTLYRGILKATPEEMSDLRKPVAEQNERTKKAIAQIKAEIEAQNGGPFDIDTSKDLRGWLTAFEHELGPDRVREIFLENGVKAHKYETTRSIERGGELVDKEGNFVRDEDIVKAQEAGAFERKPAHNYVVLSGEHVEILDRNGEPLVKEVPPEIQAEPEAAEKFGEVMTMAEQVHQAEEKANWLRQLFQDPKAVGMTAQEFGRYLKRIDDQQQTIYDKAYNRAVKEAKKLLTPEWKAKVADESVPVREELSKDPVHFADRYLRTGEVPEGLGKIDFKAKLDRAEVDRMFDLDQPDSAFREFMQQINEPLPTSKDLPGSMFGKESVPAQDMAELFGFDSARDMVLALAKLERERQEAGVDPARYFDKLVKDEATRRVEARDGSLTDKIAAEAQEAVTGVKQIEVLADELRFLQKYLGLETPITREALEQQVRDALEGKSITEARNWKAFERDTGRFGRQAELALLKQDYAGAFQAKQQQVLALMAQKQARLLDKAYNALEKFVTRLTDKKTIDGMGQDYVDHLQNILGTRFGMDLARDIGELQRGLGDQTIYDFAAEKTNQGHPIDVPDWILQNPTDGSNVWNMDKLGVDKFLQFKDFLDQMQFQAKRERTVELKGKEVEFSEAMKGVLENISSLPQKGELSKHDVVATGQKAVRWWDAQNLRLERFIDWLDKRDPNGFLNEMLIKPLQRAQGLKGDLSTKIAAIADTLPRIEMNKRVEGAEMLLDADGRPIDWRHSNLLSVMLNMGAKDNWEKLIRGYGWDENAVRSMVERNATPEHWAFVKKVWSMFETLFPDYEKAARAVTGVGLKKVEGQPITLSDGRVIDGGYYPLMRDTDSLAKADKDVGEFDMFRSSLPQRNSTIERKSGKYPVALDLSKMMSKLEEIMHYSAFAEPISNSYKVINDRDLKLAIRDAFGKEYDKMLPEWIEYIRSDGGANNRVEFDKIASWLRAGRQNAVVAFIGTKPGTAVIHGSIAAANSVREAGLGPMVKASSDILFRSPENFDSYTTQIMQESAFMRNRSHNLDRDVGAVMDKIIKDSSLSAARKTWATWATYLVRGLDQMSAVPTYLAAKRTALEKMGMNEADSIAYAEKIVRNAHGSSGLVDLPAIMRTDGTAGGEFKGYLTMFGGTWNHSFNQLRDATRRTYDGEYNTKTAVAAATLGTIAAYIIAPAFIHGGVRVKGKPDPNESWAGWGASEIGNQLMATQFGLREVASAVHGVKTGKFSVNPASPLEELATGLASPMYYLSHPDKVKTDAGKRAMLMAPTWWTGVGPTRYMADQFIAWEKINKGNTRPPSTFRDWWRLMLDARQPARR